MRKFGEDFDKLLHHITKNHDGAPEHDFFPPPHLLSKACFVAYHEIKTQDGTCIKDWEKLKKQIEDFEDFVFEVGEGYGFDNASLLCPTTNRSESSSPSDPSDAVSDPIPPPPARPPPDERSEHV